MLFGVSIPPRLRLPGSGEERHATWLELFYDLVFVVAVAELADRLSHDISSVGALKFVALFIPVWWAWVGHTVYATRFDTDDAIHRLITLVMMFAAAVMAVQIPTGLEEGAMGFAAGYVLARLGLLVLYARARRHVPEAKQMTTLYLSGFGLGAFCWAISIAVPSPVRFILWGLGMFIDFVTPWLGRRRILQKAPLDTSHLPERFGLFTLIVLGETILAVVLGISKVQWNLISATAGALAFALAVSIWWMYFKYIQVADHECSLSSGQPFIYGHLPLVLSLVTIGVGVKHLIMEIQVPALHLKVGIVLCSAITLWLISFLFIQYISMRRYSLNLLIPSYAGGILVALLPLLLPFVWRLLPLVVLAVYNVIFIFIVVIELRVFNAPKQST